MKKGPITIINDKFEIQSQLSGQFYKRKSWIQDLKFSPDGKMLAVGSHDNIIDVYTVQKFTKKFYLKKHSSAITHLDWSENSEYLHSNCQAQELLYWDMSTG